MNVHCVSALGLVLLAGCVEQIELARERSDTLVLDAVPPDAIARLESAEVKKPEAMLSISYPSDGCAIPENLAPLRFVFAGDAKPMPMMMPMMPKGGPEGAYRAYQLRLSTGEHTLTLYTTQREASVPLDNWRALLAQAESELTVTLRALAEPDRVVESKPIHVSILPGLRAGSVRYWSEPAAGALAADVEADSASPTQGYPGIDPWQSTSADASRVATLRDGSLELSVDGNPLSAPWFSSLRVDTPSWSGDGTQLVFAASSAPATPGMPGPPMMVPPEPEAPRSSIYRAGLIDANTLGEPELLFSADKTDEVLRGPTLSPDGRFVAYEQQTGRELRGTLGIVSSAGGPPQRLMSKSGWKGEGSLPSWIPSVDDAYYWLVFAQARAPATPKPEGDRLQLWAVALQRGTDGLLSVVGDPVWLPWQRAEERNQRAVFVERGP